MSNLYDLPKDLLVKLIATIQSDREKEITKLKNQIGTLCRNGAKLVECEHPGCDHWEIRDDYDPGVFRYCFRCSEHRCPEHSKVWLHPTECICSLPVP